MNDKEAALAAGCSLSVAENTKQKIWVKPEIRSEFERLVESFRMKSMGKNPSADALDRDNNPIAGNSRQNPNRRNNVLRI
jgi:hypothetical protein